jgi:hypothetical protein
LLDKLIRLFGLVVPLVFFVVARELLCCMTFFILFYL